MARRRRVPTHEGSAAKALDEIESAGDRVVIWLAEKQWILLALAVTILLVTGVWAYLSSTAEESTSAADTALSEAQIGYRLAMGATPGGVTIPEPANPEVARQIRQDFAARFTEVGEAHVGTAPGAVAFLEAGKLQQALGETEAAIASYEAGVDSLPADDALRGFLWSRLGSVYEESGSWAEAAAVYAKAGALTRYAIHAGATASAIRAYIRSGEPSSALELADELGRTEPDFQLPEFLQAQIDELRFITVQN